jgi:hypothetical protein
MCEGRRDGAGTRTLGGERRYAGGHRATTVVVAEDVGRIEVEYPVERRADRLLREMGRQAEGKSDPRVVPRAAAEKLNIDLESPVYEEAVDRLLESGYLERTQNPSLGTMMGTYRLTQEGLARAGELRGV